MFIENSSIKQHEYFAKQLPKLFVVNPCIYMLYCLCMYTCVRIVSEWNRRKTNVVFRVPFWCVSLFLFVLVYKATTSWKRFWNHRHPSLIWLRTKNKLYPDQATRHAAAQKGEILSLESLRPVKLILFLIHCFPRCFPGKTSYWEASEWCIASLTG